MTAIRRAGLEDCPHLQVLEIECFESESWSIGTVRGLFAHDKNLVFVSCSAYCVVAKVGDEAEIERLGVVPHARGRGRGEEILRLVLEQLKSFGVRRIFLEVRAHNHVALRLYQKCGFTEFRRRRGYYDDGEDAVLMERKVDCL